MTPIKALALLEKATGLLQLGRQDHANIIEAVKVINTELAKQNKKEEKKK